MRVDMNVPVLGLALVMAALMQDILPVTPFFCVKIVFLTAVALYAMLTKPTMVALTVLAWAGGLTDALGGLPLLFTAFFLLMMYGAVRLMQRVFLEATLMHGFCLTACVSVIQLIWTRRWFASGEPFFVWQTLVLLGQALLGGMLAGGVGFTLCGLADRMAGNKKPIKEGHGILWAETNR